MRQNRKVKIIAIIALCVAVVGITLGFAAFSNTLTISSSATVSPNASDFKIKTYGISSYDQEETELLDINTYTSDEFSIPIIRSYTVSNLPSASTATINDNGLRISNMIANFTEINQVVNYFFAIKNEGKYDAYLDLGRYFKLDDYEEELNIVCTAQEGTSQNLVDETCGHIGYYISFYDSENIRMRSENFENDYYVLPAGNYIFLEIQLDYSHPSSYYQATLADGDFDVKIEDVTFEFSTIAPE